MHPTQVYLFDAVRTPRGLGKPAKNDKPGGSLSTTPPQELVAQLVESLRRRTPGFEQNLAGLSLGCVGQVGPQGGHMGLISRQQAKLPASVSAQTINNNCISSLTALAGAVARARDGRNKLHLAGGVESLSQVPFLADGAPYYSDMILAAKLNWTPPVLAADLIATLHKLTKSDLDQVTLESHQRAARAWNTGFYEGWVVPIKNPSGDTVLSHDELIREDLSSDTLASMSGAFAEQGQLGFDDAMLSHYPELTAINHLHSVANCPGMADGASLVLVGTEAAGAEVGLRPRAKIVCLTEAAGNPITQLDAGVMAMNQALTETGLALNDFDCIEFMEAFAAVPAKFLRDHAPDPSKVNPNGGHLAMGHPMGATGTILIGQCLHQLRESAGGLGLIIGTAGGGLGGAVVIEAIN